MLWLLLLCWARGSGIEQLSHCPNLVFCLRYWAGTDRLLPWSSGKGAQHREWGPYSLLAAFAALSWCRIKTSKCLVLLHSPGGAILCSIFRSWWDPAEMFICGWVNPINKSGEQGMKISFPFKLWLQDTMAETQQQGKEVNMIVIQAGMFAPSCRTKKNLRKGPWVGLRISVHSKDFPH